MRSDNSYSIESIARIAEGKLLGDSSICVRSLSIDSRSLLIAEQTLFFALVGERHNGHTYIADLYKKGVRAFVISNADLEIYDYPEAGFVLVENTLDALQQLSKYHREQFSYPVIGITGSNGKTIVKEWLYQLLNESFTIVRSPKSYNSQVGVPLSLWNMNKEAELAIIEAGISQPNEMSNLAEIIQPNIGVFTHLGEAHRENFTGKLHLIYEKINLFSSCEKVVYCSDDSLLERSFVQGLKRKQEHISWSRNKNAYFMVLKEKTEDAYTRITYKVNCIKNEVLIPFTDRTSVDNAITAYVTAMILDVDEEVLKEAMLRLESIAMRLEIKEGFGNLL